MDHMSKMHVDKRYISNCIFDYILPYITNQKFIWFLSRHQVLRHPFDWPWFCLYFLDWDIPFRKILRRFWVHCCETRICCSKQNIFVELVTYKIRCRPTFSLSLSLFSQYLLILKGKGQRYPTGDSFLWEHMNRRWNLLKYFKVLTFLCKTIICITCK